MVKVVKTRVEIEGEVHEETVVVEQDEPKAWEAGREFGVVGKPLNRVDGRERVTGGENPLLAGMEGRPARPAVGAGRLRRRGSAHPPGSGPSPWIGCYRKGTPEEVADGAVFPPPMRRLRDRF